MVANATRWPEAGELVGVLFDPDIDRSVLANYPRDIYVEGEDQYSGRLNWSRAYAIATNDLRMIAALKLCGCEKIAEASVRGIERFMKL